MTRVEAAEREELAKAQADRESQAAEQRQSLRAVREEMLARLAGDEDPYDDADELTDASNAVVDLVHAGKLDEAEAAAHDLLVRYPQVPDGWDRLGMVHEKRGDNRHAADCYRRVIAFVREHADDFDAGIIDGYMARIARLDPPAAG